MTTHHSTAPGGVSANADALLTSLFFSRDDAGIYIQHHAAYLHRNHDTQRALIMIADGDLDLSDEHWALVHRSRTYHHNGLGGGSRTFDYTTLPFSLVCVPTQMPRYDLAFANLLAIGRMDPDAVNADNHTLLMMAALYNRPAMVAALTAAGADLDRRALSDHARGPDIDKIAGRTACEIAVQFDHEDVVRVLNAAAARQAMATIFDHAKNGSSGHGPATIDSAWTAC